MRTRRYPSDTTDAEWALIEPLLPVPACRTVTGGRPEAHPRRKIVDAIRYLVDNGIKWRAMPSDFPPWRTVFGFFDRWARAGVVERIRDALRTRLRVDAGKVPDQVTVIVDSQSVKAAETVSKATRGYDAGKKINGRKRHIAVDTRGLPVTVLVTPADISDRDAARVLLWRLRAVHPQLTLVWGDGAYSGSLIDWARKYLSLTVKTVKRPPGQVGFKVLPRRWVVERTLSWLTRARRNVRDYERLPEHSEAHLNWAAITLMTRRLARQRPLTAPVTADAARAA